MATSKNGSASQKGLEKKQQANSSSTNYLSSAVQFLNESKAELKKVKWPTRKELMATTIMVIIFVLIMACFLGGIDFFINLCISTFLKA